MLITDQGRGFINELSSALYNMTRTNHCVTSAYHPQVVCVQYYIRLWITQLWWNVDQWTHWKI